MEIFGSIAWSEGKAWTCTPDTHIKIDISQIHDEHQQITESSSCLFILIEIVTVGGGRGMVYVLNLNTLLTLRCHNSG